MSKIAGTAEASRTLTLLQLQGQGACSEYLEKFRTVYGDQVEITVVLCVEQAAQWDWDWAAIHLLTAPALAEYQRVGATAVAAYQRVRASAWAEYERLTATAVAEYQRVTAPALAAYQRVRATAWAELYISQVS